MSVYDDGYDLSGPEDECEGAPEPEEPCSRRCGYVSSGRDLTEHEIHGPARMLLAAVPPRAPK